MINLKKTKISKISKDGKVTFSPKHMNDKIRVMEILMHIQGWNQSDIENSDEIGFDVGVLEARLNVIEELLKLVKKITK